MQEKECNCLEIELETDALDIELGGSVTKIVDDYSKLKNLPSINGVELVGNKTSEELGITSGSDINVIKDFNIEETYEDNEVYNANAIHQLMEIFGQEITNLQNVDTEINEEIELQAKKITSLNLADIELDKRADNFEERISTLETIASELEEI